MIRKLKLRNRFTLFLLVFFLSGVLVSLLISPGTAQRSTTVRYDFNNCSTADSLKADWNFEQGFQRNRELQWYQEQNAFCEDGKLVIEGRREEGMPNPCYEQTTCAGQDIVPGDTAQEWKVERPEVEFTSASLISKEHWQYGRFEVRAKIAAQDGLWPAIWFTGLTGDWPAGGEIDLMEYYGNRIHANFAWATEQPWEAYWKPSNRPISALGDPNTWQNQFHTWRMDWDSSAIHLYVDDQSLIDVNLETTINPPAAVGRGGAPENPFRQPHVLRLNLAIGGSQGSLGNFERADTIPQETEFPTRYEIDWIEISSSENG